MLIHSPLKLPLHTAADTPDQTSQKSSPQSFPNLEFSAEVNGVIPWHYPQVKTPIHRLYELAKAGQWNAGTDVPWEQDGETTLFPSSDEGNPLLGFADYDRLPEAERRRLSWWQHRLEIAELLHGEQAAMLIASQLVSCLPTVEAKLFASTQVADA